MIEVGEDDTTETMRQKVANAAGLAEDSFHMGFGGTEEGEDITELGDGGIVVLTMTTKSEAIAALHALGEIDVTSERLEKATDPKVASLLLQAEVVTAIPDGFFSFSRSACTLTSIASSCVSSVDDIRDTSLHTILDLPKLPFVTAINDSFLFACATLTTVDLTSMHAVASIGHGFLGACTGLTTVDLTGLNALISIGDRFLADCAGLSAVQLPSLEAVTSIGHCFLMGCATLAAVDLTGLNALTSIGHGFLLNCSKLSTAGLGLHAVTSIGNSFLGACAALSKVDLRGLQAVTSIGQCFLFDCHALATVDVAGMQAVASIGSQFFGNCPSLQTVHGKEDCSEVVRTRVEMATSLPG